jgi:small subunit ribosomal protein S10|tara:strand:- start:233 stop:562 length:330 start_codon:yes stop_codon:yes gene_type:complete
MSLLNLKPKKLRISLKAFVPHLLDDSCRRIIETVQLTGTEVTGPVPLPTRRRIYCVLRSPHVNKDSREHFEMRTHKRLIDLHSPSESTMESLKNLDLSAGVDVEIKSLA